MLETRRNFENRLCSRNMMYKRDIMVWVWNSVMYGTFEVESRYRMHDEASNKIETQGHDHCS
jgi:hypothetical protein